MTICYHIFLMKQGYFLIPTPDKKGSLRNQYNMKLYCNIPLPCQVIQGIKCITYYSMYSLDLIRDTLMRIQFPPCYMGLLIFQRLKDRLALFFAPKKEAYKKGRCVSRIPKRLHFSCRRVIFSLSLSITRNYDLFIKNIILNLGGKILYTYDKQFKSYHIQD